MTTDTTMVSSTTRVWFITGASAGLGLALTRAVLARGDYVIATSRSLKSFDELRQDPNIDGTRLRIMTLDVTSPFGEIKQCIDKALAIWGRIDVLVNNAGTVTYGVSEELGAEGVMSDMNTNFVGPINVTNAVLPSMRERRDGTIVIIGSRSAYRTSILGTAAYSSSKAAVHAYAEVLSHELEQFNVRVTITVPGGFATKINAPVRAGVPLVGYEGLRDGMDKIFTELRQDPQGRPRPGHECPRRRCAPRGSRRRPWPAASLAIPRGGLDSRRAFALEGFRIGAGSVGGRRIEFGSSCGAASGVTYMFLFVILL